MQIICGPLFVRDTIYCELVWETMWEAAKLYLNLLALALLRCKTELLWIHVVTDKRT